MAQITDQIKHIQLAVKGEQVRDAIIEALEAIVNDVRDIDFMPTEDSENLVTSGGVYIRLNELENTMQSTLESIHNEYLTQTFETMREDMNDIMRAYY